MVEGVCMCDVGGYDEGVAGGVCVTELSRLS